LRKKRQKEITNTLQQNKIRIAAIEETHILGNYNYKYNGYRIIKTSAKKNLNIPHITGMPTAGVAILIRGELERPITNTKRIDARITQVALNSMKSHTPIAILGTYAPRSGKSKQERQAHWATVTKTLTGNPDKHLLILRADANGQLGGCKKLAPQGRQAVGPFARIQQTENEMGSHYYKYVNNAT